MPRPLDPANILTDGRGLSGSEGSCLGYAQGLAERQHEVALYCNVPQEAKLGDLTLLPYDRWATDRQGPRDAALSWMSAEPLRGCAAKLRCLDQQYGDFLRTSWPWEASVDRILCLSRYQANHLKKQAPDYPAERWHLLPNGVDSDFFAPARKVPGRVVWLSSHDRGLHHLLHAWGAVKQKLPHAELHVYYDPSGMRFWASHTGAGAREAELRQRSVYCLEAISKLAGKGVFMHGSASRQDVAKTLSTAEVLAYPCDPVTMTETFGVAVLEAMSSGCVPVLCAADALDELWCGPAPHVAYPYPGEEAYEALLLEFLTDKKLREEVSGLCRIHAQRYRWSPLVTQLEDYLKSGGETGLEVA